MFISIILPLNKNEGKKKITRCLNGLKKQSFSNFEVIIITFPNLIKKYSFLFKKYKFIKTYTGEWNKSESRNFGALKAKGKFLLHLDADMKLNPNLLLELTKIAKKFKATVIPCPIKECNNFWSECRKIESEVFLKNSDHESPIFINSKLFNKVGGYDEKIDPLDDWGMHLELKKRKIKFGRSKKMAELCRHTNLKISFKRMFERGQTIPILKEKYPNLSQTNIKNKILTYWEKRQILLSSPKYTLGLLILKIVDLIGFTIGYIFPRQVYFLKSVAKSYESKRMSTNFTLYKHFVECSSLNKLLQKCGEIIEIGSGTGRITKEFVDRGFNIIPTDPSSTMLKELSKKKKLPKPVLASGDKLPFKDKSVNSSFAIRVIWHHPKSKSLAIIKEMVRVSSSFVIFDIVNKKRLFKFLITPNTYPVDLKNFIELCKKETGIKIENIIPMDVTLPIWLNLFPKKLAKKLYPSLYKLDLKLTRIIPPGRYLLKFKIVNN